MSRGERINKGRDHEYARLRKLLVNVEWDRIHAEIPDIENYSLTRRYEMASLGLMSIDRARRVIREGRSEKIYEGYLKEELSELVKKLRILLMPLISFKIIFDDDTIHIQKAYKAEDAIIIAQTNFRKRVVFITVAE